MAITTIWETRTIKGFAYNSTFGAFWQIVQPSPFALTAGQEYLIRWDGAEFTRTAFAFANPVDGTSCVAVGNKMVMTGENDGDPFAIVNDQTTDNLHLFSTEQVSEHAIGVYQVIADEPAAGIVLKDFAGNETTYNVEKVMFDTSDGGTQIFSKGEAVEGVEIALDLSEGDQTVTAPEGMLVKSATIIKPETLIPENIVKDVEIAGVVGTSEGGGDSNRLPVVFTQRAVSELDPTYASTSKTYSKTASVTIPLGAVLVDVLCGFNTMQESNYLKGYPLSVLSHSNAYTVTEGDASTTLSYTGSIIITSRYYGSMVVELIASYIFDGIYIDLSGQEAVLRFASKVETPPGGEFPRGIPFKTADLSACKITDTGEGMFKNQATLEDIRLPSVLKTIGPSTFYACKGLTSINIPNGVTVIDHSSFYQCSALESVVLPNSLTTIGNSAFYYCSKLSNITLPEGLVDVGKEVFRYCSNLGHVTIPTSMTSIPNGMFQNSGLTSVTIPDSVTSIGEYAFASCKLTTVTIPDSVKSMGLAVFQSCGKLESVTLTEGITEIGSYWFEGCSVLSGIEIPESVKKIGIYCFQNCKKLASLNIPNGVTSIGTYAFYGCTGLTELSIPDSVTSIGTHAFYGCTGLTQIALPSNITKIDNYTFRGCSNLPSITIPNGVTSIGTYVFYGCSKLAGIVIPPNVTSIGNYAFYNCTSLVSVDLTQCTSVPTLGSSNFNSKPTGFQIQVPASLYDSFIAATNWSSLSSYIVAV